MAKQTIDITNWKGRKHFEWFKQYPQHYYNITKQIDVSALVSYLNTHSLNILNEKCKVSFFIAFLYLVTKSLNSIEEMRLRMENGHVVLYDVIDPAYTVMTNSGIFDNCDNKYYDDFKTFYQETRNAIDKVKNHFDEEKSYNDLSFFGQYYMTCIPWIDFSGLIHPMPSDESSYVPRICWSKYYLQGNKYMIGLNIQVSHAFVDGYPLAKAFLEVEKNINNPDQLDLIMK